MIIYFKLETEFQIFFLCLSFCTFLILLINNNNNNNNNNNSNNNNNFICIAVYTKALYRFTIKKKKKITN